MRQLAHLSTNLDEKHAICTVRQLVPFCYQINGKFFGETASLRLMAFNMGRLHLFLNLWGLHAGAPEPARFFDTTQLMLDSPASIKTYQHQIALHGLFSVHPDHYSGLLLQSFQREILLDLLRCQTVSIFGRKAAKRSKS